MGGIHIDRTASSRRDLMSYGSAGDSSFGSKDLKNAIRETTEERLITSGR